MAQPTPQYGLRYDAAAELPSLNAQYQPVEFRATKAVEAHRTNRCVTAVVLTILALATAGGAAAILATTGAPTHVNAIQFGGGAALGVISVGLTITLIILVMRSRQREKAEKTQFAQLAQQPITNDQILQAMLDAGAQRAQIQQVISYMHAAHLPQFAGYALGQRIPEARDLETQALNEQEQAVFSAIAAHPNFTSYHEIQRGEAAPEHRYDMDAAMQRPVLELIPQNEANAALARMEDAQFFQHVQAVLVGEAAPKTLAALAADDRSVQLQPQAQRQMMERMSHEQAAAFVAKLSAEQYAALAEHVDAVYYAPMPTAAHNLTVANALAGSPFTSALNIPAQRRLMEHVDPAAADGMAARLGDEAFDALAAEVQRIYFAVDAEPVNHVIEALYQKASRLTPEQNFAFIGSMEQESANAAITLIDGPQYAALARYAIEQEANAVMEKALAQSPAELAALVGDEALPEAFIGAVAAQMNDAQKAAFLEIVNRRAGDIQRMEARDESQQAEFNKIARIVSAMMDATLTMEFARSFAGEEIDPDAQALLGQLQIWSHTIAGRIFALRDEGIWHAEGFMRALDQSMGARGKQNFSQELARLHGLGRFANAKQMLDVIGGRMVQIRAYYPEGMPVILAQTDAYVLQTLANTLQEIEFADFRAAVVDNAAISEDQTTRYAFALDVLERMEQTHAVRLIAALDKSSGLNVIMGYPRYNAMAGMLAREAAGQNIEEMPEARRRLIAHFSRSEQAVKAKADQARENGGIDWTNFNAIRDRA